MKRLVIFRSFSFLYILVPASFACAQQLTDIGTLGGNYSMARAISANGAVIVGDSLTAADEHNAFVYENGVMTNIGTLGGTHSYALGISGYGKIVVGFSGIAGDATGMAFCYSNGIMSNLGTLGGNISAARGVSYDGAVIVGESGTSDNKTRAFKYENGAMTDIGALAGGNSAAFAVSADGAVIVGWSDAAAGRHAFYYENAVMTDMGTLGGNNSYALAVSADGKVSTGYGTLADGSTVHAFRYENGTMQDIGTLGGTVSHGRGISGDGSVIVGESNLAGDTVYHAFKYADGEMTDLGTLGGTNSQANAISYDGSVIIGYSNTANGGFWHAFVYRDSLVDADNTIAALNIDAQKLTAVFDMKSAILSDALRRDCAVFGKGGLCLSVGGGKYASPDGYKAEDNFLSAVAAYKIGGKIRAGLFAEKFFAGKNPDGFDMGGNAPLFGGFIGIGQSEGKSGASLRLSFARAKADLTVTRDTSLENTEAGKGDGAVSAEGISAEAAHGFAVGGIWARVFTGARYENISRAAYSESSGAEFPARYDRVSLERTAAFAGAGANLPVGGFTLALSGGAEYDISADIGGYAGEIDYIGEFNIEPPKTDKTRFFGSAQLSYRLSENSEVKAGANLTRAPLGGKNAVIIQTALSLGL